MEVYEIFIWVVNVGWHGSKIAFFSEHCAHDILPWTGIKITEQSG